MILSELELKLNNAIVDACGTESIEKPSVDICEGVGRKGKCHIVTIRQMYYYIKLNFQTLQAISEVIGTEKIDVVNQYATGGCDTCDYGSSYNIVLECYDVKL